MKFRHLLPVLALCSPMAALAVPAYPGLVKQTNPDGTTIEVRIHGDEFFSYYTDAQNKWIMERDETGMWVIAERGGAKLAVNAENVNLLRQYEEASFSRADMGGMKYAELSYEDGRSKFPCTGSGNYLIVLLQYSDTKFSMADPQAYYNDWFNKENFVDGDIKISARDYYRKVSSNKFTPNFVVSPVITLPASSKFYTGGNKYRYFSQAIRYAMQQLDQQGFDFSRFDLDHDGTIDNVYFIYAGFGQADTGDENTIWPHASSFSGLYGGLYGGRYACSNELRGSHKYLNDKAKTGIGTFCHEFGHVLGLPDMYDPNYDPACEALTPGDWSIMCNGSYLGDGCMPASYAAYDRWACRWMEYTDVTDGQKHTLAPLTTEAKAYRLKAATTNSAKTEYFLFENRTKQDIDTYIPGNGLLIWHVDWDYDIWRMNRVNSDASHMRLTVMPPSGKTPNYANWPATGVFGNMIYNGSPNTFKTFNAVSSTWTPGVFNISYDNDSKQASFDYYAQPQTYNENVTEAEAYRKGENDKTGFKIHWKPATGAQSYLVTVQRRNTSGSMYYVDNYNNRVVTGTDVVVNESEAMMKQENMFIIRPVGSTMPSTQQYESSWFRPIDLNGVTSVLDDTEFNVTVENGNITAPAGARVFNMQGIETGTRNLGNGIYVVVYGTKTVKVVVR